VGFSSCLVSGPSACQALGPFFEKKSMMEVLHCEHAFSDTGSLGVMGHAGNSMGDDLYDEIKEDVPFRKMCTEKLAKVFKAMGRMVPNLSWKIQDVWVTKDRIVVLGEASGTPTESFFGVEPAGRS